MPSLLPLLLSLLLLLPPPPPASTTLNYLSYSPAIYTISSTSNTNGNSNNDDNPPPGPVSSQQPPPSPQPTSPAPSTVPFSPAIPPSCPPSTLSCDTIGEPSWCCTDTQNCAFDDAGDVACCPRRDFCKGLVDYGAGAGAGAGSNSAGGGSSGNVEPSPTTTSVAARQGSGTVETEVANSGGDIYATQGAGPVTLTVNGGVGRAKGVDWLMAICAAVGALGSAM